MEKQQPQAICNHLLNKQLLSCFQNLQNVYGERNLELHLETNDVREGSVGRQTGTWEPLRLPMEAKEYVRLFGRWGSCL